MNKFFLFLTGLAGIGSGLYAYVTHQPLWIAGLLFAFGPILWIAAWITNRSVRLATQMRGIRRSFGLLIFVYGLAGLVAVRELSDGGRPTDLLLAPTDNYADTISRLYPDRGESHYLKYMQSGMCYEVKQQELDIEACRQYDGGNLRNEMLDRSRRLLHSGIKDKEEYLYYPAQLLVMLEADPAEIEAAVDKWRRTFPQSVHPDPRTDTDLKRVGK